LHPREQSAVERLRTIRDPYVDPTAAEIEKYHQKLADNASGILGSHYKDGEVRGIHGYPFDSGHLVPHASDAHLAQILRSGLEPVMRDTWNTINDSGLVGHMDYANRAAPEAFDPMRPSVQHILNNSYSTAVDINDATRKAIDEMLALGGERGYTVKQLAEGVPTDMFPGVKSLITETYKNRALAIARTELGRAQVASQRARYAAADVAQVEIQDGGGPTSCEECDARDGDVVDLASEVDLLHPNCIVSTLPVLPEFGAAGGA
jgi:hypothetical protein